MVTGDPWREKVAGRSDVYLVYVRLPQQAGGTGGGYMMKGRASGDWKSLEGEGFQMNQCYYRGSVILWIHSSTPTAGG